MLVAPRVLTLVERVVRDAARTDYLSVLPGRRAEATARGVRFWVFENNDEPGRFVEFTEAATVDELTAWHDGRLPAPVWREVQGV